LPQEKLDWLREQIEMRSIGLGWTELKGQWFSSKDENTGSVDQLRGHLKTILEEELEQREKGELPDECPAPQLQRKTFKSLGTPTVQASALSDSLTDLDPEELLAAAEKRRKEVCAALRVQIRSCACERAFCSRCRDRRESGCACPQLEVRGEIDWVEDRQPPKGTVPLDNSLVGTMVEVRWRYRHKVTGKPIYIWCTGEVLQVADGGTTK
jgi:hypothetical protein